MMDSKQFESECIDCLLIDLENFLFQKICDILRFRYVDEHANDFIGRLKEAVAIKSVSAWPDARPEVVKMVEWTKKVFKLSNC